MAYDYKDYLEEAKQYLQKNSPAFSAYEDYYQKAVNNIGEDYDASAEKLNAGYLADTNQAVAQSAINAKNIAQYMASRGLSRSGEAEQETINSNLSLNKALSELASSKYNALSELYANKNQSLLALEKEYAAKKDENEDWLYSAAFDLASAQLSSDRRDEDIAREEANSVSEREYEEYIRQLEKEYEKQLLEEKRAYEDKVRQEEQAFKLEMAVKSETETEGESEAENGYTPSQTPSALAKSAVTSYTADGKKVSGITDRIKLYDYLTELAEGGIAESYMKELLVSLKASGYSEPTEEEIRAYKTAADSEDSYKSRRESYYQMYIALGIDDSKAGEWAEKAAVFSRLDYCYTNSETAEEFGACCEILGISESLLDEYLARVNAVNSDKRYKSILMQTAP
ncbi:MAG: hypothetical protein PHW77_06620 [Eubacteriales bacterium]|nr:hypothetical protein [Eubacteriales bacterium]